jgi:shikimate kinase
MYYQWFLQSSGKPYIDEYGSCFDPNAVEQLKRIIDKTGADIVVESTWKYLGLNAMNNMKKDGVVVYLKLSCEEIVKRVNNIKTRGIAMGEGKSICDIYNERIPLYEKYADITIDAEGTSVEEAVSLVYDKIVNKFNIG